ncbi:hypothetical protein K439DRAFT_239246 [Ramaria rubella]|nr:hypothetical protein K439DRAFT_239246 [Ramaria rubella]
MLLKITSGDHLNSQLVNVNTGTVEYTILTRSTFTKTPSKLSPAVKPRRTSISSQASVSSNSSSKTLLEKSWDYPLDTFIDGRSLPFEEENIKHTWILDAEENTIAEIVFVGTSPRVVNLAGEKLVSSWFSPTGLFPNANNEPEEFNASTRIEDLSWIVNKASMELVTSDGGTVMSYHTNARLDAEGSLHSAYILWGDTFLDIRDGTIDILEKTEVAELLVTFCLMELFRRGRFNLTPYVFDASSTFDRYHAIIRDNYFGAAFWKMRRIFGRTLRSKSF